VYFGLHHQNLWGEVHQNLSSGVSWYMHKNFSCKFWSPSHSLNWQAVNGIANHNASRKILTQLGAL